MSGNVIRIKGWDKFQHFKDRKPPWIKLYRDLLDDREWHRLDAKAAKALVMLWLIASENDGALPDRETLAFRLRTTETEVDSSISKLSHWLIHGDITPISERYQGDAPETETETEGETKTETDTAPAKADTFPVFWDSWPKHPRKTGRDQCAAKWKTRKCEASAAQVLAALEAAKRSDAWLKNGGEFIPAPLTWLNQSRWEAPAAEQAAPSAVVAIKATSDWIEEDRRHHEAVKAGGGQAAMLAAQRLKEMAKRRTPA